MTEFSEIFDLFMVQIKDWRLQFLFENSKSDFEDYLSGFLKTAIPQFAPICITPLGYDEETKKFNAELRLEDKVILAKLMVEQWLTKEVQDVTQMNLHLQDRDFKVYSESQNLREKSLHLDKVKEYNSISIGEYSYRFSTNWQNWLAGDFFPVGG